MSYSNNMSFRYELRNPQDPDIDHEEAARRQMFNTIEDMRGTVQEMRIETSTTLKEIAERQEQSDETRVSFERNIEGFRLKLLQPRLSEEHERV